MDKQTPEIVHPMAAVVVGTAAALLSDAGDTQDRRLADATPDRLSEADLDLQSDETTIETVSHQAKFHALPLPKHLTNVLAAVVL